MELKDPRINPMTSVTDVMVTQDLKYCKAYISVLGDAESAAETLKGLEQASGYIRRELASLKRFKDDVKEVKTGFECGLVMDGFNDIKEGDIIEAYIMVDVPR